jgi:hypothetical protein
MTASPIAQSHSVLIPLLFRARRLSLLDSPSRSGCHFDPSIDLLQQTIVCLLRPDRRHVFGSTVAAVASVFSLLMTNLCEATPKGLISDQLN